MNLRVFWVTAAILAVLMLLAQIAGASNRTSEQAPGLSAISALVSADLTGSEVELALPAQASAVAVDKSAKGLETANEARASNRGETTITDEARVNTPASAPRDSSAGAGTRPGWGCGDTKHTHSGPPGRPDATPPPGCTKP
ncbi:MAG TPA: hypothetical protein VGR87_15855 [Candidatus Limnocylindria bacterium]|jgi:hypothetical protein|nr:hypothetical protein [Candidatus Limnocylindria bacterium]